MATMTIPAYEMDETMAKRSLNSETVSYMRFMKNTLVTCLKDGSQFRLENDTTRWAAPEKECEGVVYKQDGKLYAVRPTVQAPAADACGMCGGTGRINAYAYYKNGMCFTCNGTGKARK